MFSEINLKGRPRSLCNPEVVTSVVMHMKINMDGIMIVMHLFIEVSIL